MIFAGIGVIVKMLVGKLRRFEMLVYEFDVRKKEMLPN